MPQKPVLKALLIAAVSAAFGYLTMLEAGLTPGILTMMMSAWILFQFRGFEKIWGSLGNFQNPVLFGLNITFLTYIYITWNDFSGNTALALTAAFIIGGIFSTLITKYWNIGG